MPRRVRYVSIGARWGWPAHQGTGRCQLQTPPPPARQHDWLGQLGPSPSPDCQVPPWGQGQAEAGSGHQPMGRPQLGRACVWAGLGWGSWSPVLLWCCWGRDCDGETPLVSLWYKENILDFIHREEILFWSSVVGKNSWHLMRQVSVHYTLLRTLNPIHWQPHSPRLVHASWPLNISACILTGGAGKSYSRWGWSLDHTSFGNIGLSCPSISSYAGLAFCGVCLQCHADLPEQVLLVTEGLSVILP